MIINENVEHERTLSCPIFGRMNLPTLGFSPSALRIFCYLFNAALPCILYRFSVKIIPDFYFLKDRTTTAHYSVRIQILQIL